MKIYIIEDKVAIPCNEISEEFLSASKIPHYTYMQFLSTSDGGVETCNMFQFEKSSIFDLLKALSSDLTIEIN